MRSPIQHQPRMLTNASFSKQQISIRIGTVSWQEVTSIRIIALQTRCPTTAMTCETKWMILWLCAIDVGYTITGYRVRLEHVETLHT
jgi:hypothetical protein